MGEGEGWGGEGEEGEEEVHGRFVGWERGRDGSDV